MTLPLTLTQAPKLYYMVQFSWEDYEELNQPWGTRIRGPDNEEIDFGDIDGVNYRRNGWRGWSDRYSRHLVPAAKSNFAPLWWVQPCLDENRSAGLVFGLFEPIYELLLRLYKHDSLRVPHPALVFQRPDAFAANKAVGPQVSVHVASQKYGQPNVLQPWQAVYNTGPGGLAMDCHFDKDIEVKMLTGIVKWSEVVTLELLPMFLFKLMRLRAKKVTMLTMANDTNNQVLAALTSLLFALCSLLSNWLGTQLWG